MREPPMMLTAGQSSVVCSQGSCLHAPESRASLPHWKHHLCVQRFFYISAPARTSDAFAEPFPFGVDKIAASRRR